MSILQHALDRAEEGFWVFRLQPNGKVPMAKGWQMEATRDPATIRKMFSVTPTPNIGIFTSRFDDDKALLVVDVDIKEGKRGDLTISNMPDGKTFPSTAFARTASGGMHLFYLSPAPLRQSVQKIGPGVDTRSRGGYVVGAGSVVNGQEYKWMNDEPIAEVPAWIYNQFATATVTTREGEELDASRINLDAAITRCRRYLEDAPIPDEGSRNDTAFKVAAEMKDLGIDVDNNFLLMLEWNDQLEAPLDDIELSTIVHSAYTSGQNAVGIRAPEMHFSVIEKPVVADPLEAPAVLHPFEEMNKDHALVLAGGGHHILFETTDEKGEFKLEHTAEASFHKFHGSKLIMLDGSKPTALTKAWIASPQCRRYQGLVFAPGRMVDERFYNLWRGFAVEPYAPGEPVPIEAAEALRRFKEHTLDNICLGNADYYRQLIGFAAHMMQKPWQKPLVSVVFKGRKGVGKNVFVDCLRLILRSHAIVVDDERYVTGNFNAHVEGKLLLIVDEATWAGDKRADSKLKGMITGDEMWIERKGMEAYPIANYLRMFRLGNEKWLVPASDDERRYFVLDVSDARRGDRPYFSGMMDGMRAGGARLLLEYLLKFDLAGVDVNYAPVTPGLINQKHASLEPFDQWWLDCLTEGELVGNAYQIDFKQLPAGNIRSSFQMYCRSRQIKSRLLDDRTMMERLSVIAPSLKRARLPGANRNEYVDVFIGAGLLALRSDWQNFIGGEVTWPNNQGETSWQNLL